MRYEEVALWNFGVDELIHPFLHNSLFFCEMELGLDWDLGSELSLCVQTGTFCLNDVTMARVEDQCVFLHKLCTFFMHTKKQRKRRVLPTSLESCPKRR